MQKKRGAAEDAVPTDEELIPEEIKLDEDPGLRLLQVYCTADNIPMADEPNRYVTMKFGGVFALEACEIVWYVDGEYRAADEDVTITKTRTVRHKFDFSGEFFHTPGRTLSQGCVRLPDEAVMYLWNIVPVGSTVVIY